MFGRACRLKATPPSAAPPASSPPHVAACSCLRALPFPRTPSHCRAASSSGLPSRGNDGGGQCGTASAAASKAQSDVSHARCVSMAPCTTARLARCVPGERVGDSTYGGPTRIALRHGANLRRVCNRCSAATCGRSSEECPPFHLSESVRGTDKSYVLMRDVATKSLQKRESTRHEDMRMSAAWLLLHPGVPASQHMRRIQVLPPKDSGGTQGAHAA